MISLAKNYNSAQVNVMFWQYNADCNDCDHQRSKTSEFKMTQQPSPPSHTEPGAGVVQGRVSRISSLSDSRLLTTSNSRLSVSCNYYHYLFHYYIHYIIIIIKILLTTSNSTLSVNSFKTAVYIHIIRGTNIKISISIISNNIIFIIKVFMIIVIMDMMII